TAMPVFSRRMPEPDAEVMKSIYVACFLSFVLLRIVTSGMMPQYFRMLLYIQRANAAFSVVILMLKPPAGAGAAAPFSHTTAASSDSTQHSSMFSNRHSSLLTDDENDICITSIFSARPACACRP